MLKKILLVVLVFSFVAACSNLELLPDQRNKKCENCPNDNAAYSYSKHSDLDLHLIIARIKF